MKLERMLSIVMTLLERDKVSAKYFADKFEVSPRTIYRDVEALALAGIPIVSVPGVNGGLSIIPGYKVDKKLFTTTDIANLLTGLDSIAPTLGPEGAATLERLRGLIPREKASEIELRSSQLTVDLSGWMGNHNLHEHLSLIKNAISKNRLLAFEYATREGGQSTRRVEPHRLVLKENKWYVQAFCLAQNGFRLFKLSRMSAPAIIEETFTPRGLSAVVPEFAEKMRAKEIPVQLLIAESLRERVLDYCPPENFRRQEDGRWLVHFPFVPDDYGYGILLGFGENCECLSPPKVRTELKQRILRMAALYKWCFNLSLHFETRISI